MKLNIECSVRMFSHYITRSSSSHDLVDIWGHQFRTKFITIVLLDILCQLWNLSLSSPPTMGTQPGDVRQFTRTGYDPIYLH